MRIRRGSLLHIALNVAFFRQVGNKLEHLYKILIIGELGTGKTSIIKRYVHQFFTAHYRATIGVDFALKVVQWDPNTTVRLQLWDIAGESWPTGAGNCWWRRRSQGSWAGPHMECSARGRAQFVQWV